MIGNCFSRKVSSIAKTKKITSFFGKIKNQNKRNGEKWWGIIGELSCDGYG